ncbi:MAG TPA: multicopper oxidase domain-containing protein [Alphaproteobacteria bacterium]|nr:multicopper oxidase domain-containing protein [Alphaproteobacteria bacterium]
MKSLWSLFALLALTGGIFTSLPVFAQESTIAHPCGIASNAFRAPPDAVRTGKETTIDLTVKQDQYRLCFVYNGIAEAPVIHARPGDTITLHVRNEISDTCYIETYFGGTCPSNGGAAPAAMAEMRMAGDEVQATPDTYPIVPNTVMPITGITNVHTHGLEVSPALHSDEVIRTQLVTPALAKAGKGYSNWTYTYKIPADHPPGLYWYHPHYHGETDTTAQMGLSGAIVIEDAQDTKRAQAGVRDQVIIVRDIAPNQAPVATDVAAGLADVGINEPIVVGVRTPRNRTTNPNAVNTDPHIDQKDEVACVPGQKANLYSELTVNRHFVQEGNPPDSAVAAVPMFSGETRLIRLLNAAADTYILPQLVRRTANGTETYLPMRVVGLDGVPLTGLNDGRRVQPYAETDRLKVPPGGRVEFILTGPAKNVQIYLKSGAFDAGCASTLTPRRTILRFTGILPKKSQQAVNWTEGSTAWLNPAYNAAPEAKRTFAFLEYPHSFTQPGGSASQTDFYITQIAGPGVTASNVKITPFDMEGPPNITVNLNGAQSRVEEWTIQNYTVEAHAFHIHQIHFREVKPGTDSTAGQPLLDDIHVPIAQINKDGTPGKPGEVKVKLVFTPDIAGTFPYHCHVLFHEDNGMMGSIRILAGQPKPDATKRAELSPAELLANPKICRPQVVTAMSSKAE